MVNSLIEKYARRYRMRCAGKNKAADMPIVNMFVDIFLPAMSCHRLGTHLSHAWPIVAK